MIDKVSGRGKGEITALKKFVQERNIEHLIHFTRYENLESILKNGIMTRDALNTLNLHFYKNSISLSVSFPNHKMFYKYRKDESGAKGWVVIDIKPEVLWQYYCVFCKYNAADSRILKMNKDSLYNIKSFEEMFSDPDDATREGVEPYRTTDPQAEVLVFNNIPIKHIQAINFENEVLLEIAKSKCKKDDVASNINFYMAKHKFKAPKLRFTLGNSGMYFEPAQYLSGVLRPNATDVEHLFHNPAMGVEETRGKSLKVLLKLPSDEVKFIGFISAGDPSVVLDASDIDGILKSARDGKIKKAISASELIDLI